MKRIAFFAFCLIFLEISIVRAQRIQSGNFNTTGYIKPDGTIQNSSFSIVGYVKSDGRVLDGNFKILGYMKNDGRILDFNFRIVGYAKSVKREWAAVLFFFFSFN